MAAKKTPAFKLPRDSEFWQRRAGRLRHALLDVANATSIAAAREIVSAALNFERDVSIDGDGPATPRCLKCEGVEDNSRENGGVVVSHGR